MPLILSGNVASAAAGAYEVANSCMFNAADSVRLYKTGSTGNRRTWTWSCWLKRCTLGGDGDHLIFGASSDDFSTDYLDISFTSADKINIQDYQGSEALRYLTTRVFRDVSAWMNIVIRVDTTQGTASNRLRIYINGVEETAFDTETDPSEDAELLVNKNVVHQVGGRTGAYGGLYMAECVLIDGSSLAPTSFGEFNSDSPTIWQPIDVSGLTFGTNGFYLDFEASGNLGNDANGGTDLTEDNLAATDQMTDSPTNNFAVLNPLRKHVQVLSEGNLELTSNTTSAYDGSLSTIGTSKGKWYCEVQYSSLNGSSWTFYTGMADARDFTITNRVGQSASGRVGDTIGNLPHNTSPDVLKNGSDAGGSWSTFTSVGDIMGMAMDCDNGALYFSKNGVWENSSDPESGDSKTGAMEFTVGETYMFGGAVYGDSGAQQQFNFGNPIVSLTSGNADANGYGNFEFEVPDGYYAICTKNLAEEG